LIGFPSAPFTAPSQSPVPVGLTPDLKPRGGASDSIVAASGASDPSLLSEGGAADGAGAATLFPTGVETLVPASIAFCCAPKVVETTGHPLPGPFKFCNVTAAAFSRAD